MITEERWTLRFDSYEAEDNLWYPMRMEEMWYDLVRMRLSSYENGGDGDSTI